MIGLLIAGGAVGVAFYGYSSHKIGERLGLVSAPYAAIYGVLLVSALSGTPQPFDLQSALLMSLVTWGLYTHALLKSKVVRLTLVFQVAAVAIGFLALVVFPLFTPDVLTALFAVLYRGAAFAGWLLGAKPGFSREKE